MSTHNFLARFSKEYQYVTSFIYCSHVVLALTRKSSIGIGIAAATVHHENIFSHLIKSNTIMGGNPKAFALAYTAPILSLIGICDRQPQKEDECVKMLKNHVALFFDSVNKQAKKNQSEEK